MKEAAKPKRTKTEVKAKPSGSGKPSAASSVAKAESPGSPKADKQASTSKQNDAGVAKREPAAAVEALPSILLEGDQPASQAVNPSGTGRRYEGGGAGAGTHLELEGQLPEAYGTKRLYFTARDPHWIYAHWDLTRDQQQRYNGLAADKHLVLRVHQDRPEGTPFNEIHVHPESRNWFVHVGRPNARFCGVLGYYQRSGKWVSIATSEVTVTPPDTVSDDTSFWIETLPADLRFDHLVRLVKTVLKENVPLMEAIQQLRAGGFGGLPESQAMTRGDWTAEQERALADLISMDAVRRVWVGSLEITELVRRRWHGEISSWSASQYSVPASWSGAVSSFSSPMGGRPREKSFWFNVNAELIIYGATEPDAAVTIGGRKIRLRPDGTFSYRFSLPDGQYELPAVAISSDGTDQRTAGLAFERRTEYRGEVGKHPQDATLQPPKPEHLS